MFFSIVVPVYNRPNEIKELLESLVDQEYRQFEVIVVEDGSSETCREIVVSFGKQLQVKYLYQENQGQGFARNYGMINAMGDYFVLFDSDCIIPPHYLKTLNQEIRNQQLDAHGGADGAAVDFSVFQKAINFSMTSFWTTGGIRGKMKNLEKYQARGYNMGFSREVFMATKGFVDPNRAEDIELSIRIKKLGYRLELVKEAYVYHKRKNTFRSFLAQSFSFGRNRINVSRYHPGAVQLVHLLPFLFLVSFVVWLTASLFCPAISYFGGVVFGLWTGGVLLSAGWSNKSLLVGLVAVVTSYGQLFSYGAGLFTEGVIKTFRG